MSKFLTVWKRNRISTGVLAAIIACLLVGDYNALFSTYASRQRSDQVPHGWKTEFWIYTPEGYTSSREKGFPLLISLHGGSAIGNNLTHLFESTHENPAQLIHINKWYDLPFIVVSPQLRRDPKVPHYNEQTWPPELIDEVVEYVKSEYNVDTTRLYITGISSGAMGAWDYARRYPAKVAALLPLGGQAPREDHCRLKDVPIWAFHGENDVFVRTRFTTDAVKAIRSCPDAKYVPHATVSKAMEHEVWDQVFNGKGGYDVFKWLLTFSKGDDTNKPPFVFLGHDRKMKLPEDVFYLTAEYFDSDGSIEQVRWTQVDNGSERLRLANSNGKFLRVSRPSAAGIYKFRLEIRDNEGGVSTDEVAITLLDDHDSPAVISLSLTNQAGTAIIGRLANDQVYDLNQIGNRLNVYAEVDGWNVTMRWAVNSDQRVREANQWHLRFWKDYGPFYLREVAAGPVKSGWTVSPGEYLICATATANGLSLEGEGSTLCYKITFVEGNTPVRYGPGFPVNAVSSRQF